MRLTRVAGAFLFRVAWDTHTIHGFYFALYHAARSMTRASWLPYELDLLWSFYVRARAQPRSSRAFPRR